DAGNYTISVPATALGDILRKTLTATASADDKTYDGTTAATGSIELDGVVAGEAVAASASYAFGDADAGEGKAVTVSGVTLSGADAGNYTVVVSGATVADILRRAITVTADAQSKEEGSDDPALTYAIPDGSLVPGDALPATLDPAPSAAARDSALGAGGAAARADYQATHAGSTLPSLQARPV